MKPLDKTVGNAGMRLRKIKEHSAGQKAIEKVVEQRLHQFLRERGLEPAEDKSAITHVNDGF